MKRLIVGLLLGMVIGAVLAAIFVKGLGIWSFALSGAVFAYLGAALTGAVTGLVAGKPIWSADGKIEAGLKSFFGALLALGGMFVLRQWVHVYVNLTGLEAGMGEIGDLPAAALPMIAALLAGFFELDNTGASNPDKKEEEAEGEAKSGSGKKVRVAEREEEEDEEAEEEPVSAKKKRR